MDNFKCWLKVKIAGQSMLENIFETKKEDIDSNQIEDGEIKRDISTSRKRRLRSKIRLIEEGNEPEEGSISEQDIVTEDKCNHDFITLKQYRDLAKRKNLNPTLFWEEPSTIRLLEAIHSTRITRKEASDLVGVPCSTLAFRSRAFALRVQQSMEDEVREELKNDVTTMKEYLAKSDNLTKEDFWQEPWVLRLLEAIHSKRITKQKAKDMIGVSYNSIMCRCREYVKMKQRNSSLSVYREISEEDSESEFNTGNLITMKEYLKKNNNLTREDFWDEPWAIRLLDAVHSKRITKKKATDMIGVSCKNFKHHFQEHVIMKQRKSRARLRIDGESSEEDTSASELNIDHVTTMKEYLEKDKSLTRKDFWQEPWAIRVLDAIYFHQISKQRASEVLGVSYEAILHHSRAYRNQMEPRNSRIRQIEDSESSKEDSEPVAELNINDFTTMKQFLENTNLTREDFWQEPSAIGLLEAIVSNQISKQQAANVVGVSYSAICRAVLQAKLSAQRSTKSYKNTQDSSHTIDESIQSVLSNATHNITQDDLHGYESDKCHQSGQSSNNTQTNQSPPLKSDTCCQSGQSRHNIQTNQSPPLGPINRGFLNDRNDALNGQPGHLLPVCLEFSSEKHDVEHNQSSHFGPINHGILNDRDDHLNDQNSQLLLMSLEFPSEKHNAENDKGSEILSAKHVTLNIRDDAESREATQLNDVHQSKHPTTVPCIIPNYSHGNEGCANMMQSYATGDAGSNQSKMHIIEETSLKFLSSSLNKDTSVDDVLSNYLEESSESVTQENGNASVEVDSNTSVKDVAIEFCYEGVQDLNMKRCESPFLPFPPTDMNCGSVDFERLKLYKINLDPTINFQSSSENDSDDECSEN